jgi:tetraacyldisaccharide 4'-kinase
VSRFWERRWYEGEGNPLLTPPLALAALGFGAGVALRGLFQGEGRRVDGARVVSVGNLNVGGSGKTPVVIHLATWAAACGRRVAVLSRGYGRTGRGELRFDAANLLPASEVGDEPRLIAQRCPKATLWVGANRAELALKARDAGADFLILDDGMQHRRLARDADIAVVDSTAGFGNGQLLPLGPLREPVAELRRASLVWLRQTGASAHGLEGALSQVPRRVVSKPVAKAEVDLRGRPVVALAALARTRGFLRTLDELKADVIAERFFPDHHVFSARELDEARCHGALIVTTEKDLQRLPSGFDAACVRLDEELVAGRDALAEHLGLDATKAV